MLERARGIKYVVRQTKHLLLRQRKPYFTTVLISAGDSTNVLQTVDPLTQMSPKYTATVYRHSWKITSQFIHDLL